MLTLKLEIPSHFAGARLTYWEWSDFFLTFDWTEVTVSFHFMVSAVVNQAGWYVDDVSASEY